MTDYANIYDHIYETNPGYANTDVSPGLKYIEQFMPTKPYPGGSVVDIGCGAGHVCGWLKKYYDFDNVIGCDVSETALELARRLCPFCHFTSVDISTAHEKDYPEVDMVTCFDVIEHLDAYHADRFFGEVKKILITEGVFLGSVSLRPADNVDLNGDNLHRTVRTSDHWLKQLTDFIGDVESYALLPQEQVMLFTVRRG